MFLLSLFVGGPVFCIVISPLWRLSKYGQLYYGGQKGFYSDTLFSLFECSLPTSFNSLSVHFVLSAFLVILFGSILAALYWKREGFSLRNIFVLMGFLLVLIIVAAHYLIGSRYPIDRVALFLYPLFILIVCFCLNDVNRFLRRSVLFFLGAFFAVNFLVNANFYKTRLWDFEANTRQILERVNEQGKGRGRMVNVVCSKVMEQSIMYYMDICEYSYVNFVKERRGVRRYDDIDFYVFLSRGFDVPDEMRGTFEDIWEEPLGTYGRDVFLEYPDEDIYVFTNFRKL